ncbi:MAG: carotenoid biosynthesis protein, partial [Phaeodactylibacter sp.]|nr:carotenoid biosynthesis protein [Phaeodactylibacter sp.]
MKDGTLLQNWYQKIGIEATQRWKWTAVVLTIFYLVGIVGILGKLHPDFILLTPFNLLLSLFLMLAHHENWSRGFWLWLGITFLVGFFAEVLGVNYGLIFGSYSYGPVLGWKVFKTPLLIGVNWIILSYGSAVLTQELLPRVQFWWQAIVAALLMVLLDLLIEPVAIQYDFWQWEGNQIPLQNYLGWFFVALLLQLLWFRQLRGTENKVGLVLFILQ